MKLLFKKNMKHSSDKDLFELNPELKAQYDRIRERLDKKHILGNIKFPI